MPPIAQSLRRDPCNVDFTHIDKVIEGDDKDKIAEESVRKVRTSTMSLMSTIKEPSINLEESEVKIAISEIQSNQTISYSSCPTTTSKMGHRTLKPHSKTYMAMTNIRCRETT
jgi:hypothetical protein